MCDQCKALLLEWSHLYPAPITWCGCNAAERAPSCAVTSYATHEVVPEAPWCLNCGHWVRPASTRHARHMGLRAQGFRGRGHHSTDTQ